MDYLGSIRPLGEIMSILIHILFYGFLAGLILLLLIAGIEFAVWGFKSDD